MPDPETTDVVFRVFPAGDVIAIFPSDPGTSDPFTCSSYQHVGQHGSCNPAYLMRYTVPDQYADLKRELESAPYHYRLRVRRRIGGHYLALRRAIARAAVA
jgi:hypothetical protein